MMGNCWKIIFIIVSIGIFNTGIILLLFIEKELKGNDFIIIEKELKGNDFIIIYRKGIEKE